MALDPTQFRRALLKPAALILLALPLFAGTLFVRQLADGIIGPLAIAVSPDGERIAVAGAGDIYHLDAQGALQGVDADMLDPAAREAGIAWLGDGLLVSPDTDGDLLHCSATACSVFSPDPYAPNGAIQVFVAGNRLWLSEAGTDRLQRYFDDGRRIDMPLSDLLRPGSLWLEGDQLYVANSGARALQRYTVHKRGIDEPEKFAVFSTGNKDAPIDQPTRFVRSGEGFQAIFSDHDRRHGVLVAIDNNGTVTQRAVPGLVNPVALDLLGDALLVVDEDRMQVLQVAADGATNVFGDDSFRAQLASRQPLRSNLRIVAPVLMMLAALTLAVGGSWLLRLFSSQRSNPPLAVAPDAQGIIWLPREIDFTTARVLRQCAIFAPAALAPAAAAAFAGYPTAGSIWALLSWAAATLPALRDGMRARPPNNLCIGMRGHKLVITDSERGLREYPLLQVAWDDLHLRPEPALTLDLTRDGIALFHLPTIAQVLMPRLNVARRISFQ